ncbi:MAG: hypothetical protein ABI114_06605 [Rhodanobacter sp.]
MKTTRQITALLLASALVGSALAQTAPLNLKLPPNSFPAASSTTAPPATDKPAANKPATDRPGVYYGDTSGRLGNTESAVARPECDDSTFNQPQVHGSVSTGIATGSRLGTSTWNAGTVNIHKQFGDCDDPGSSINFSIGVGGSHGDFGRYGRYGR